MMKRLIGILLPACLLVGLLPTVAYAYDNMGGVIESGTFNEEDDE